MLVRGALSVPSPVLVDELLALDQQVVKRLGICLGHGPRLLGKVRQPVLFVDLGQVVCRLRQRADLADLGVEQLVVQRNVTALGVGGGHTVWLRQGFHGARPLAKRLQLLHTAPLKKSK